MTANVSIGARARRAGAVVIAVRPDPAADAGFVGRESELAELIGLLGHAPGTVTGEASVAVVAVAGAPGVGKTALAQSTARAAVARGRFLGGALFVDLHGYDPDPAVVVWPAHLWAAMLRGLGVSGDQVPAGEAEQATAYHQLLDRLADADRSVLLVLDNVADAEQVMAVLPRGASHHRALITSRDTLGQLPGARQVEVEVLDPEAAMTLLTAGVRSRLPADGRIAADAAAARLVELCGGLPLALQIVAALLADEPDRPVAELAAELSDERGRLAALDYGPRWAVRAAFDLSHRRLDEPSARLFRLLAAVPGSDFSLEVAAAVADQPPQQVRVGLRALRRAHLVEPQPTQSGLQARWRMHDLIRLYAHDLLTAEARTAGFLRVLTHYRHAADLAKQRFSALPGRDVPEGFDTPQEAMTWVLRERAGLVAAVVQAAENYSDEAIRLAVDLAPFLSRARLIADSMTTATAAMHGSRHTEPGLTATAWNNLGNALREARRFDEAITAHEHARGIYGELGYLPGEGESWNNLGNALQGARRFYEAIIAHEQDLAICQELGDRHGEGVAWNNLGSAMQEVRRFDEAITAQEHAREIYREIGDRHGEGMAWGNLGNTLQEVRRFDEAIKAHEHARDIFREAGDRHGEGKAWTGLGNALQEVRRFDEAIKAQERARDIFRGTRDRHDEGSAWNNLGNALQELRRYDEAIKAQEHARKIYREVGDRHGEAMVENNLGNALREVQRFDEAIKAHEHAREVFRNTGDRGGEGAAWNHLGLALRAVWRFDKAITAHQHACDIYRRIGDRHGEGTAWNNLGCALQGARRFNEAIDAHEHAREIYRDTGDRHGEGSAGRNLGLALERTDQPQAARSAWVRARACYQDVGASEAAARINQFLLRLA